MAALVQSINAYEAVAGTTGTTLGSNVTAGNLLVMSVSCASIGQTIDVPTDDQMNAWHAFAAAREQVNVGTVKAFYTFATGTGANTVQAPISNQVGGYKETILAEYSGISAFDNGDSVLTNTLSLTTGAANEVLLAFCAANYAFIDAGSGFTTAQIGVDAILSYSLLEHQLDAGAPGSKAINVDGLGGGGASEWIITAAAFTTAVAVTRGAGIAR